MTLHEIACPHIVRTQFQRGLKEYQVTLNGNSSTIKEDLTSWEKRHTYVLLQAEYGCSAHCIAIHPQKLKAIFTVYTTTFKSRHMFKKVHKIYDTEAQLKEAILHYFSDNDLRVLSNTALGTSGTTDVG